MALFTKAGEPQRISTLKNERGFTIVELLIVIIVIGILATLVLIAYNNVQGQARDTKRQADAASLRDAAATFKIHSSIGAYPSNTAGSSATSGTFAYDIANMSPKSVILDSTVTDKVNATVPSSTATNNIQVIYCGTGTPTATTATGMKFIFWSETKNALGTPAVTTGSGC